MFILYSNKDFKKVRFHFFSLSVNEPFTETFTPVPDQDMDMNHRPGSRPFSLSVNKPLETHRKKKNNKKQFTLKWSDEMSTFDGHVLFLGPRIPLFWTSGDVSSGFQGQSGKPYSH